MNFIKRWIQKSRETEERRGFDFAAGRMLEDGNLAIVILEQHVQEAKDFNSYDLFDKGIQRAISTYKRKNP